MKVLNELNAALIGRYLVDREIGAGGMATVYLARDVKHDRLVALKVLNPELGAVLGVERFLSEIRVTANLQHPNLLPLFDSGEAEGKLFYVMPFVEGKSLRARLDMEKQLPVDEAIHIATSIAGALDYAHKHGVIHRDLKPENVLMQSGQPVIADFGIALAISKAGGQRVTQTGISLGTPHYMSPEQATGDRQIDGRTDLYSLGAMLYEMLTGEPPHTGATAQAVIARLLTDRPRAVRSMRDTVPEHVEYALDVALAKLPADRFASAHDFAQALSSGHTSSSTRSNMPRRQIEDRRDVRVSFNLPVQRVKSALPWMALAVVAAVGAWGWIRRPVLDAPTVRFRMQLADGQRIQESVIGRLFAVSPDGRELAYLAADSLGTLRLYMRPLDQLQSRAIEGSIGARNPVFSPDGRWLAFIDGSQLKKVPKEGGASITLGTVGGSTTGVSWGTAETIIVGGPDLLAFPAVGGEPRVIASGKGEYAFRWPLALPDADKVIVTIFPSAGLAGATLAVVSTKSGEVTRIGLAGSNPLALIDGLLFYGSSNGAIMAVPFDAKHGRVTGNAVPVVQDVLIDGPGAGKAALSPSGVLIYQSGQSFATPVLFDDRGVGQPVMSDPRAYSAPRFSPDGKRIAFTLGASQAIDIWVYDVAKATFTRLTTEGVNMRPEWTPDGKRLLFRSERNGGIGVWWQPSDGSGPAELLLKPEVEPFEAVLSPDGKRLIYRTSPGAKYSRDIFYVELADSARRAKPLVVSPFADQMPRISPDGKWMAYQSDESGQFEIYVRTFPDAGARIQISTTGGAEPLWSKDGRTLFYRAGQRLIGASVTTSPAFAMGTRRVVLEGDFITNASHANYDVAPDGKHFLMIKRSGGDAHTIVVHNWLTEVRQRLAAQR